jgi:hypothetical protein
LECEEENSKDRLETRLKKRGTSIGKRKETEQNEVCPIK